MPAFLRAFGLSEYEKSEEAFVSLIERVERFGQLRQGYQGLYLDYDYGSLELVVRAVQDKQDEHRLNMCGFDTQLIGQTIWEVTIINAAPDPNAEMGRELMRQCLVRNAANENGSIAIIDVVNADVQPTYMEGMRLNLQVCALPSEVTYYKDAEAYEADPTNRLPLPKAVAKESDDDAFAFISPDMVWPIGLLANDKDTPRDLIYVRGEVIAVSKGFLPGKPEGFNIVTIDTQFGPLDIVHSSEMVEESQRSLIRRGSTIVIQGIVSADAVTREYHGGRIFDEDHHLMLLAGICGGDDAERLRAIATEDVRYTSEYNDFTIEGLDAVIAKLCELKAQGASKSKARLATVVETRQPSFLPRLPYGVGKRCAYLYMEGMDDEEVFLGVLFATLNAQGLVTGFEIVQSDVYTLAYDKPHHDTEVLPHLWPRPKPTECQERLDNLVAYAHACVERAAATLTPSNGGLVWFKERWEYPADYEPLLFAYDGVPYLLSVLYINNPDALSIELPGFFHRPVPLQPRGDFVPVAMALYTKDGEPRSHFEESEGALRTPRLAPLEDFGTRDDSSPMGLLEQKCLALQEAKAFLERSGLELLSTCGYPGVGPEMWFRDAQGRPCWLRVHFATTAEACDTKTHRGLEQELPRLRANDGYLLTVHLPDFGVPKRGPRPTLVVDPLRRLALAP